jgi:uncharacterized membrane protein (DUF373 family)
MDLSNPKSGGSSMKEDSEKPGFEHCHIQGSTDPLVSLLQSVLRHCVRILALLMTLVIVWGLLDVVHVLWQRLNAPPYMLLNINDILATFGAFMAVLIAIEIFANIVVYLEAHIIHIRLVLATALMAAARKAIVLDFHQTSSAHVFALAAIILALGLSYWLIARKQGGGDPFCRPIEGSLWSRRRAEKRARARQAEEAQRMSQASRSLDRDE